MSFTLQVTLEGVLSLVPDKPFFPLDSKTKRPVSGNPTQVTVLLPDLRQSALASWTLHTPEEPIFRSCHWPILIFDLVDYDPASTQAVDLVVRDLAAGTDRGVILLDRLHVRLPDSPVPQPLRPALTVPRCCEYPDVANADELTSLWWVPQMQHLFPHQPRVGRNNDPNGNNFRFGLENSLVAAVTLDQGRFYVRDFNRVADGTIQKWEFGYFDGDGRRTVSLKRAVGNQLSLELDIFPPAAELTVTQKMIGSGPFERQLILRPPAGSQKRAVQVRLANIEPEVLRPQGAPFTTSSYGGDPDFEAFYSMANIPFGNTPVPLFPDGGGGRVDKPCTSSASTGF